MFFYFNQYFFINLFEAGMFGRKKAINHGLSDRAVTKADAMTIALDIGPVDLSGTLPVMPLPIVGGFLGCDIGSGVCWLRSFDNH